MLDTAHRERTGGASSRYGRQKSLPSGVRETSQIGLQVVRNGLPRYGKKSVRATAREIRWYRVLPRPDMGRRRLFFFVPLSLYSILGGLK